MLCKFFVQKHINVPRCRRRFWHSGLVPRWNRPHRPAGGDISCQGSDRVRRVLWKVLLGL